MISEQECLKILNQGEVKYSKEEAKIIRDFLITLATIEYEDFKSKKRFPPNITLGKTINVNPSKNEYL
jgi:hypothetical protein